MRAVFFLWLSTICLLASSKDSESADLVFHGMCDASAAVAIDHEFFAAASDEDSRIRIYRRSAGGPPVDVVDLSRVLDVTGRFPETDLEGAARVGDRIYWITSHARNRDGKFRPNRYRFFATRLTMQSGKLQAAIDGKADKNLIDDLETDPLLAGFHFRLASQRAPRDRGGLNIEGLCATPEGHLLIGFRNPVPDKKALLVPLLNPGEVLQGQKARFGNAILLDLDGRGIRDIAYAAGKYWIVAGAYDGGSKERVYQWDGGRATPELIQKVKGFNPEAIVVFPDKHDILLLSDDGNRQIGGVDCKDVPNEMLRQFRAFWLEP
ncbi:MAG: DUF3616 domain-containing protein [Verrucomicrobiota bacterium]